MNIAQAKEQIKNAMTAYFTKNEFGDYKIPVEKQRPVLLIGPPGIGKTAIMEQIASELGVGLVSYSMTHHTRQSALGLPFITTDEFEGMEYRLSEYTMSEIIGSIYKLMKETDVREGILFLDEINCVSETLAPCMLQFLQYKVFGQHRIPKGWIVVTAGNPPEYNKSVREFDIVTWDRLKRIDVEPDYESWKKYASMKNIHPAILTYLSARKKDFYKIESTVDGRHFVTARGWEDLSEMIRLYEENGITVDENLISQYIQHTKTSKDFAIYYDLFRKYRSDYKIDAILAGDPGEDVIFRATRAPLDERLSFLGMLFDAVAAELREVCEKEDLMDALLPILKEMKAEMTEGAENAAPGSIDRTLSPAEGSGVPAGNKKPSPAEGSDVPAEDRKLSPAEIIDLHIDAEVEKLEKGKKSFSLSAAQQKVIQRVLMSLHSYKAEVLGSGTADAEEAFGLIRAAFQKQAKELSESAGEAGRKLDAALKFCEKAFGDGDEILIFITELTVNYFTARFIGHYGCDRYFIHNKELQFSQRQTELDRRVQELTWEV